MNILMCSVPFRPSVGGIETVTELLARGFHEAGHRLTVVTQSAAGAAADNLPYAVLRRPGARALWRAVQGSDVVLHNNISLRLAWPLLALRRPWVVAHHTWLPREGPAARAAGWKRLALRHARNVAVSEALAADLGLPCEVLPNPYDSALFRRVPGTARTKDIVCVGRLVSDKGFAVMLHALALMHAHGHRHTLTIVGEGPEGAALQGLVSVLGLQGLVQFTGALKGQALVQTLHQHRVAVVPSVWEEPFGLVALEAQACGCVPVVAASGGLPQAAGPAGVVFAKGDPLALAARLVPVLRSAPPEGIADDPRVRRHLQRHQPAAVAQAYLQLLEQHAQHRAVALARQA
ncbi:hypothetical protein IP87_00310 [beta proteobacterium AAP121]|nr:hypothetical protein IP80_13245 [beta proteobacterium AAP65]KPG01111.1 hypothetical protein IP87_00310 [beta proteobacterium AAP121]